MALSCDVVDLKARLDVSPKAISCRRKLERFRVKNRDACFSITGLTLNQTSLMTKLYEVSQHEMTLMSYTHLLHTNSYFPAIMAYRAYLSSHHHEAFTNHIDTSICS